MESTQSKYRRVPKSNEQPEINENEVRITTAGKVKKYVDYALGLFGEVVPRKTSSEDEESAPPKVFETIVLKATGRAINHAVTTAEVVKRRVAGIHQVTQLDTLEIEDEWEPLEEGLLPVKTSRRVASVTITLSKDGSVVDTKAPGYQAPLVLGPLSGEYFTQTQLGLTRRSPASSRGSSGANQTGGRRRRGRGGDGAGRGGGPDRGTSGAGGGTSDRGSDRGSERSGGRRRGSGGRRTPDSGGRTGDGRRDDRRGGGGGRREDRRDEREQRDRRDDRRRRRRGPRDQRDE